MKSLETVGVVRDNAFTGEVKSSTPISLLVHRRASAMPVRMELFFFAYQS
jgi:hypothetical protein